jgi:hypothetical protein
MAGNSSVSSYVSDSCGLSIDSFGSFLQSVAEELFVDVAAGDGSKKSKEKDRFDKGHLQM